MQSHRFLAASAVEQSRMSPTAHFSGQFMAP